MDNKREMYDLSITVFQKVWQSLSRTMGPLSTTIIFNRALQKSQTKILKIDNNNLIFQDFSPEIDIGSYYSSFIKLKNAIIESLQKLTGNLLTERMEKEVENTLAAIDKIYKESLK
jgi:hypothetical protein